MLNRSFNEKNITSYFVYSFIPIYTVAELHNVTIQGFSFSPSDLSISIGDTVLWTNDHTIHHTATSTDDPEAWIDENMDPGETFMLIFTDAGSFPYDCLYHSSMTGNITVADDLNLPEANYLISTFQLHSNFPNPFNPITNIEYSLSESNIVQLIIYDNQGKHIQTLIDAFQNAGQHSINWNAASYPSGIYFLKMIMGREVGTRKLMLVK